MPSFSLPVLWRGAIVTLLLGVAMLAPGSVRAATATTVLEDLNLRGGPGLSYPILALMSAGSTVTVTGDPTEGWYPIAYQERLGWGFGAYLSLGANSGASTRGAATVVTAWLNLRSGPGSSYSVLDRLPYGTVVEILGGPTGANGYSWFHVNAQGFGIGFVAGEYLDAGGPAGGGPPAAVAAQPQAPPPAPPAPAPAPAATGNAIVDIITAAAIEYGQSPAAMLAVARCESNLDPAVVNRSSGASGLFQFLPGTWRTTPFKTYSIFDPWANANAAAWMWQQGRRGEWVC